MAATTDSLSACSKAEDPLNQVRSRAPSRRDIAPAALRLESISINQYSPETNIQPGRSNGLLRKTVFTFVSFYE